MPLVEVQIVIEDRNVRTLAYLDTGATYSVFIPICGGSRIRPVFWRYVFLRFGAIGLT